jgi:hypothetical protein
MLTKGDLYIGGQVAKSKLLEGFKQQTADQLLKVLLEGHESSPDASQDLKVSIVVDKLNEVFRNRQNANNSN